MMGTGARQDALADELEEIAGWLRRTPDLTDRDVDGLWIIVFGTIRGWHDAIFERTRDGRRIRRQGPAPAESPQEPPRPAPVPLPLTEPAPAPQALAPAGGHLFGEPHPERRRHAAFLPAGDAARARWCGHGHRVRQRALDCAAHLRRRTGKTWWTVRSYHPKPKPKTEAA